MFENAQQAIDWLTTRTKSNHPFSDFKGYLASKGNPQYNLKCIHVAGTNGKGSTTNYLRNILQTAGYKTGSFTSPHLITHLDRIRINDKNIEEDYFLNVCNKYYEEWNDYDLTMFEIDMFISILYFIDKKVDIVVYEVGLGGRLDATNTILPIGAVITNIEMDHMAILGNTIEKIAYEKAGIIKPNIPVVTFEKKEEAIDVFKEVAKQNNASLIQIEEAQNIEVNSSICFDYKDYHLNIPTLASYQISNASAAVEMIDTLVNHGLLNVTKQQIEVGIQTSWAGRFEIVNQEPLVIIDGAHNENGVSALCESLDNIQQDFVIVFSALADKEYHKMLTMLMGKGEVIVTHFENHRSTTAQDLACGLDVEVISDYNQAINKALHSGKAVVITGSLYFISIVREIFKHH